MLAITFTNLQVQAQCWKDEAITQQMRTVAQRYYPGLLSAMPRLEICSSNNFPDKKVGGQYVSGIKVIQIPEYGLNRGDLAQVLAHELGHAEADRRGWNDYTLLGHGVGWMRIMIEVGLEQEAQRVADYLPGALQAFQLAKRQGYSPPDQQWPGGNNQQAGNDQEHNAFVRCVKQMQVWVNDAYGQRLEIQWVQVPCQF
jgi:hypothetical protein